MPHPFYENQETKDLGISWDYPLANAKEKHSKTEEKRSSFIGNSEIAKLSLTRVHVHVNLDTEMGRSLIDNLYVLTHAVMLCDRPFTAAHSQ